MPRILLVDFSKAFDRVDHHTLLTKCVSLALTHFVALLSTQAYHKEQRLAPLVHHINDLRATCDFVKYVDDCTTWEVCSPSCVDTSLPTAADEMAQWTTTNKTAQNYDKTKKMHICFKNKTPNILPITINDRQIEQVNCTVSHDLT